MYIYFMYIVISMCSSIDLVGKSTLKAFLKVIDVIRIHLVPDISSKSDKIASPNVKRLNQAMI